MRKFCVQVIGGFRFSTVLIHNATPRLIRILHQDFSERAGRDKEPLAEFKSEIKEGKADLHITFIRNEDVDRIMMMVIDEQSYLDTL
uniref:Uncharacterized protein n=1 Tax=Panagrolaimus davidi TaxID=227884 RepID=A0A914PMK9_9BILA